MAADVLALVWVLGFLCGTLIVHVITYAQPPWVVDDERPRTPRHKQEMR